MLGFKTLFFRFSAFGFTWVMGWGTFEFKEAGGDVSLLMFLWF
jgi:hypothetical protein